MKVVRIVLVALLALPAHAAMYKWVDAQGRVQYSDTPPPANARKVEEKKIVPNTIQTTGAPFAVQEAAKRNPVTVWMNECGDLCSKARDFLARRGVPHSVRNPARQDEQEAWKKASGGDNSVPLLVIGSVRTLKGFDDAEWNSALDAAGYPRSAPAIKPKAVPSADAPPAAKPAGTQAAAPADEKK
jgi:glutaredoxin